MNYVAIKANVYRRSALGKYYGPWCHSEGGLWVGAGGVVGVINVELIAVFSYS